MTLLRSSLIFFFSKILNTQPLAVQLFKFSTIFSKTFSFKTKEVLSMNAIARYYFIVFILIYCIYEYNKCLKLVFKLTKIRTCKSGNGFVDDCFSKF